MTAPWQPVRQAGRLGSRIVAQIEGLIADRRLQPGDRLPPERDLALLLGVSRPSVREAVRALEATGRVLVKHGTGVWIQPEDTMRRLAHSREVGLRELFAMREVLEVPAAGWAAAAAAPGDVAGLDGLVERMAATDDVDELRRLDTSFHLRIAELAGNRFLLRTMGVLHDMLGAGMQTTLTIPGRLERSRAEHRRLLEALAAGDASAARRAMRHHIRSAQAAGLKRLVGEEAVR